MRRLLFSILVVALLACTPKDGTVISSVASRDVRIEIVAVPGVLAVDGDLIVRSASNGRVLQVTRLIEADDYVEDIRRKVGGISVENDLIIICLEGAPDSPEGTIFTSKAGVTVQIVKGDPGLICGKS